MSVALADRSDWVWSEPSGSRPRRGARRPCRRPAPDSQPHEPRDVLAAVDGWSRRAATLARRAGGDRADGGADRGVMTAASNGTSETGAQPVSSKPQRTQSGRRSRRSMTPPSYRSARWISPVVAIQVSSVTTTRCRPPGRPRAGRAAPDLAVLAAIVSAQPSRPRYQPSPSVATITFGPDRSSAVTSYVSASRRWW